MAIRQLNLSLKKPLHWDKKLSRHDDIAILIKAISYWIDEYDIMIKRVNAYKQQEFVAYLTSYAHR